MAPRFIAAFAIISLVTVGLITGSVLMLDHEARRTRAEDQARRDLDLVATKLKGSLTDPEAGPLIASVVRDIDAYAGAATGRRLRFDAAARNVPPGATRRVVEASAETERVGASLSTPAGLLTATRAVESNGPLRPAFVRYGGFASMLAIGFAILAGLLVSRSLNRRAGAMNAVFAAAAAGAAGQRVPVNDGPAEFRTLARNLNAMLETQEHRLFEMRLSSDRLAHDLRTPLTRIAARLAMVDASNDPVASAAACAARGEINALIGTLNALLDLREIETESSLKRAPLRLDTAILDAIDLYEAEAEDVHGVTITATLPATQCVGSAPLIVRAVANLLDNALHAAPRGSTVAISLTADAAHAAIEIHDRGDGFPASLNDDLDMARTLRSCWNGNGLGLSIVRAIARRHGGGLRLDRHGTTTVARLTLSLT